MVRDLDDSTRSQMFLIVNPLTRSGKRLHEDSEMADWAQMCREEQEGEWKKEQRPAPLTKTEQHDLGGVLMDIKASREYARENSGHGRYW